MTIDSWKWAAEKLGIPTLFCLVLCYAIYKTGSWTADHIFTPLVNQHIKFLEVEQETMHSVAADVGSTRAEQEKQTRILQEIRDDQKKFPAVAEKMP